jgi:hypothetical protein
MNTILNPITRESTAVDIGMSCLGCIDELGAECSWLTGGRCTAGRAANCMRAAMVDHAEAQAEIVLATISVMARHASGVRELRAQLAKVENVIQATSA